MKKFIYLSTCILMSCLVLTGCEEKTADDDMIVIEMSDEAKQYQENTIEKSGAKEAQQEGNFDLLLEKLSARDGKQELPECEFKNKLESFVFEDSDVYTLSKDNYENIVLYIHGGGWSLSIGADHAQFCDSLVDTLNAKVYMPLYPLAPQVTSTETYAMIENFYKELLNEGKNIYVMGDSAGANIALGLMYTIKEENLTPPTKLVLISPCTDMSFSNEDMKEINETDPILDLYGTTKAAIIWAGEDHLRDPKNSALFADVSGYPDTLIFHGTNDILYPDSLLFYQHMKDAGVNVTFVKGVGLWHCFPVDPIPEAEQSLEIIKDFCTD